MGPETDSTVFTDFLAHLKNKIVVIIIMKNCSRFHGHQIPVPEEIVPHSIPPATFFCKVPLSYVRPRRIYDAFRSFSAVQISHTAQWPIPGAQRRSGEVAITRSFIRHSPEKWSKREYGWDGKMGVSPRGNRSSCSATSYGGQHLDEKYHMN